jgi:hypothetical protein
MRFGRRSVELFALVASLGLMVPLLTATQSSAGAAPSSPPAVLQPTQVNVTITAADQVNASRRYGEPEIAANPKNSNNLVYTTTDLAFSYACEANPTVQNGCALVGSAFCNFIHVPLCQPIGLQNNYPGFSPNAVFYSFDRGRTWTNVPFPDFSGTPLTGLFPEAGDPALTVAPDGTFYLSYNVSSFSAGTDSNPASIVPNGGVAISRSTDGGVHWSHPWIENNGAFTPVLAGTPIDRTFETTDSSTGTIYEVSGEGPLGPLSTGNPGSPFLSGPDRWLVASTNGMTWTTPFGLVFGGILGPISGNSITAAQGTFATAGRVCNANLPVGAPGGCPTMAAAATAPSSCAPNPTPCVVFQTLPDRIQHPAGSWTQHVIPEVSDIGGSPLVAADPLHQGQFAVAFFNAATTEMQVYVTRDSGDTWTGPAILTDDPTLGHWHPWMSFSPNGVLGIMWQNNPPRSGKPYTVWAAISRDGGTTFAQPLEVSQPFGVPPETASPAPDSTPFFGNGGDDFSYITLDHQFAFVAWADWRPGPQTDRQGFFSAIPLAAFNFAGAGSHSS